MRREVDAEREEVIPRFGSDQQCFALGRDRLISLSGRANVSACANDKPLIKAAAASIVIRRMKFPFDFGFGASIKGHNAQFTIFSEVRMLRMVCDRSYRDFRKRSFKSAGF